MNKWSADEVANLNAHQKGHYLHPFTCPNRSDGEHREFNGDLGALVATRRGWICPWCDYTQDWAHGFMLSGVAIGAAPLVLPESTESDTAAAV